MKTATTDQVPASAPSTGVIAIYGTHQQAEAAVMELQHAGFDMTKLSIVGRGSFVDEHVVGYYHAGDRMKFWGMLGAMWGGITGLLFTALYTILQSEYPVRLTLLMT